MSPWIQNGSLQSGATIIFWMWVGAQQFSALFPSLLLLSLFGKNVFFPSSSDRVGVISGSGQWPHIMPLIELPCIVTRELITTLFAAMSWPPTTTHCCTNYTHQLAQFCESYFAVTSHIAFGWPAFFTFEDCFCSLKARWTSLLPAQGS